MELVIRSGPDTGKTVEIGERLLVGRESKCGLILEDPKVSRRHAVIIVDRQGEVTLEDLGSTNGTYVDGAKLSGNARVTGTSQIRIGDTMIAILIPVPAPSTIADSPQNAGPPRTVGDEALAGETPSLDPESTTSAVGAPTSEMPAAELGDPFASEPRSDPETTSAETSPATEALAEPTVADIQPAAGAHLVAGGLPASAASAAGTAQPTVPDTTPPMGGETLVETNQVVGAATIADTSPGAGNPTLADLEAPSRPDVTVADVVAIETRDGLGNASAGGRKGILIGGAVGLGAIVLAVILFASLSSKGSSDATASASTTTPAQIPVAAPIALTPDTTGWTVDPKSWSVTLTWEAPAGAVDHYNVKRNGKPISKDVVGTTFTDVDVVPGAIYHYRVVSIGPSGDSAASKQRVRTPRLPPYLARLQGPFSVHMHVVSTDVGSTDTDLTWVYTPNCRVGPCAVTWTVRGQSTRGVLAENGGIYSARLSTPFFIISCHGAVVDEQVDVRVHLTNAAVVGGAWRATKFVGTLSEYLPAGGGCLSGSTTWSFAGSVVT